MSYVLNFKCVAHHMFNAFCFLPLIVITSNLSEDNVEECISFVDKIVHAYLPN